MTGCSTPAVTARRLCPSTGIIPTLASPSWQITDPDNNVGPLVTTGNYGKPNLTAANHYSRFVVGTVWQDRNGNSLYDPGEGYGNVTVSVYPGNFNAVTAIAGGYAVPILAPGTYTVTFSGAVQGQQQVVVGTTSVLVDLKIPTGLAAPDEIPSRT